MKVGVLGTGIVGRTLAAKLAQEGKQVMIGGRDVQTSKKSATRDGQTLEQWLIENPDVQLGTFKQTAEFGELLFNATNGMHSLDALKLAGPESIDDKILIDVANPLDFSHGMPPSLGIVNTSSLGEEVQKLLPRARVVKALNTVTAALMVNPMAAAAGDHHLIICGDDDGAKKSVSKHLKEWFGWQNVIDLGDITNARGSEMYLPLWVRLMGVTGTPLFNIKIVK